VTAASGPRALVPAVVPAREVETTATGSRAPSIAPAPRHARLTAVFPPGLGAAVRIDGAVSARIGRSAEGTQLAIDHRTLSRRHAEVVYSAGLGGYMCRDLGSHNGTEVDGVVVGTEPRPLSDGAVLRMGDVLVVFETGALGAADGPGVDRTAVPGASAAIGRLRGELERAAVDRAPVLVIGETGTGKESIAREVHRLSGRRGPLVTVNCAALTASLVESELFGHVKGAFTGADEARPGLLRAADRGSLLLDEVGELPFELQAKLLRALQEGEVQPVGSTSRIRVDVRVIAATHRDLSVDVDAGRFRADLYARLSLWELRIPPLRERRVDVLGWLERFDAAFCAERRGIAPLALTADAAEAVLRSRWALNLRGVQRLVRAVPAHDRAGGQLPVTRLPAWLDAASRAAAEPAAAGSQVVPPVPTRDEFIAAFEELGGSVRGLARRFRRDRKQIYRWLDAHGLRDTGAAQAHRCDDGDGS
jgi:DNA-binding NtrC family response regulator